MHLPFHLTTSRRSSQSLGQVARASSRHCLVKFISCPLQRPHSVFGVTSAAHPWLPTPELLSLLTSVALVESCSQIKPIAYHTLPLPPALLSGSPFPLEGRHPPLSSFLCLCHLLHTLLSQLCCPWSRTHATITLHLRKLLFTTLGLPMAWYCFSPATMLL